MDLFLLFYFSRGAGSGGKVGEWLTSPTHPARLSAKERSNLLARLAHFQRVPEPNATPLIAKVRRARGETTRCVVAYKATFYFLFNQKKEVVHQIIHVYSIYVLSS